MSAQYSMAFLIVLALAILLRINYITDKSRRDSLAFWQQRFNTVAADYHALQKDHDAMADLISQMREDNGKLAGDVFNCNFTKSRRP